MNCKEVSLLLKFYEIRAVQHYTTGKDFATCSDHRVKAKHLYWQNSLVNC